MKISRLELIHVTMPMVSKFESAHSSRSERELFLVKLTSSDGVIGWGECAAEKVAGYSDETIGNAAQAIRNTFGPDLASRGAVTATDMDELGIGNPHTSFARSALQQAILDAELRMTNTSLAQYFGITAEFVSPGVVVGLKSDQGALLRDVDGYIVDGYKRIKFKIEPHHDLEVVRQLREHVGPDFVLQVDANGSYRREDMTLLGALDEFNLAMVEQPLPPNDLEGSKLLAEQMSTPICLDEGIGNVAEARHAIKLGAGHIVNVKPGRVGGILEAHRVQQECAALSAGCWIGGMLETGVGRTANVVLAGDAACTHPGDVSASKRYFETDLTEPFVLVDGRVVVPREPGAARAPITEVLKRFTTSVERII